MSYCKHSNWSLLFVSSQCWSTVGVSFVFTTCMDTMCSRLHKCLTCFKLQLKSTSPLMGELLFCRINQCKPFLSTAIDYGEPYDIKILSFIHKTSQSLRMSLCVHGHKSHTHRNSHRLYHIRHLQDSRLADAGYRYLLGLQNLVFCPNFCWFKYRTTLNSVTFLSMQ